MQNRQRHSMPVASLATLVVAALVVPLAGADEGMWTLHGFPSAKVRESHGVEIGQDWLDRVQRSTVRLDGGCTGSFASPDGLVLTNNHCTWGCIRNLSSEDRNLSETGFFAATRAEERQCPGARISVLVEMEEITQTVHDATAGKPEIEANEERKALLSRLEARCEQGGGLSCESVDLYHGGQYFLYKYERYDDVRLVFAPELAIAAFGGDPDNFNFPRWCLDMSFLRVYRDGQPAATPNHLKWKPAGARAGEPVFVIGHPGSTDRLYTLGQLEQLRRDSLPRRLLVDSELRGRLTEWGRTSDEAARQVQQRLLGIENGIKVRRNRLLSLLDDTQMAHKAASQRELREAVEADPGLSSAYGSAWDEMDRALAALDRLQPRLAFVEHGLGFQGALADWAHTLVRGTREKARPNEERLREYRTTALPRVEQRLLAPRPVAAGYETLRLGFSLDKLREWLGPDDPVVRAVLGTESPRGLAERLVRETRLADPDYRRSLWEGGPEAVEASDDPLIEMVRLVEPHALELRRLYDDEVEAVRERASEQIAKARFAALGTDVYPDATFTLRVTFGAVKGWQERGEDVPPFTRLGRVFERATGEDPFRLPESWLGKKASLDLDTPFNFVATTDIIGGNSGSPAVDAGGRLVGLAFDGNIHSIAGAYWFDESKNRTVLVHPAAIVEALGKVYGAETLLEELTLVE
jgi:hypothetical protein